MPNRAVRRALPVLACAALAAAAAAFAQDAPKPDARVELAAKIPGTRPEELRQSPISGIYELSRGAEVAYVSSDGRYAINGDLVDLKTQKNLTEEQRRGTRARLIGAIPESDMVIFGPREPKYTITVFTDVDCGYCRKLHSQIAEYNRLGIRVRYLSYPRTGPNSESWTRAEQVWCAPNRNEALTRAKLGQPVGGKVCPGNPVAREYALGREFNLEGTPALVLANGELLPGYLPPDMLLQHLSGADVRR